MAGSASVPLLDTSDGQLADQSVWLLLVTFLFNDDQWTNAGFAYLDGDHPQPPSPGRPGNDL